MKTAHQQKGFTLIELLIVISIIAALSVTVFVALNPAQRLKDAKDSRRTTDVSSILTAFHTFIVDNKGSYPSNMPAAGTEVQLGTDVTGCAIATGGCAVTQAACVDFMTTDLNPSQTGTQNLAQYLKSMPIDPSGGIYDATKTGYALILDANGIVTIKACGAEGTTIAASQ